MFLQPHPWMPSPEASPDPASSAITFHYPVGYRRVLPVFRPAVESKGTTRTNKTKLQTKQTTNTELLPQCVVPLPAIWSSDTLTLFLAPSAALTGLALDAAL